MHAAIQSHDLRLVLETRLLDLWERTGDEALHRLGLGRAPRDGADFSTEQHRSDWIGTCLMEAYRNTGDPAVFALLFEVSRPAFLIAIQAQLRRTSHHVDPQDVLQEVFLNIYRYPHRFLSDRSDAFRNWGHRIVRNTLLKFLRGENRRSHQHSLDDDMQCPDTRTRAPDRVATEGEGAQIVNRAYLLYLSLYLRHFDTLTAREQLALTMVEVEGHSYRDTASRLGVRLENLKMVIFRSRRKIFRGMARSLEELALAGSSEQSSGKDRGRMPSGRGTSPRRGGVGHGRLHPGAVIPCNQGQALS